MSDALRKNFSDKVEEKITPDSQKSGFEKAKESVTGAADNLGKNFQSEESKGVPQKAADVGSDAKKDVSNAGQSIFSKDNLDNLQTQAKGALDQAGKYINQASEYLGGKAEGSK